MAGKKEITDISSYKKKWQFNIGLLIFGIIFIYLVVTVLMYMTRTHVTAYEVREGSIVKDTAYTGLAVRQEEVITTDRDGYINYYVNEGSKIGLGQNVYTMSDEMLAKPEQAADANRELSDEEQNSLLLRIQKFNDNSDIQNFDNVYTLKSDIESSLQSISNQTRVDLLNQMIASNEIENLQLYPTSKDGIISYSIDGMEGLKIEDVTKKMLEREEYSIEELTSNEKRITGQAAYKLITSNSWSLAIELSEQVAMQLRDTKEIKVRFSKDDQTTWANLEVREQDDIYMGILSFDNAMVRYLADRYVSMELVLQNESGLKIPKSSVTKKAFYVVPQDYITQGGNGKETGILRKSEGKKGNETTEFVKTDIYFTKDDKVYLDPNAFESGDVLLKPESNDTYPLQEKKNLKGVFNINKGYAVFKQIEILGESEEYYIVQEGNSYGLSNYDHIALDSSNIHENDVVFQ